MSKITSKLFELSLMSQMFNSGLQSTGKSSRQRKGGNVLGDHFYKFLSLKRNRKGKWSVRK